MAEIPAPNYTQIPNVIFELMADKDARLTEAELRVILAIARKTFGWHKKRDKISLSQLAELTAMSKTSVISGLEAAAKRGIIRRIPDANDKRGGNYYELIVEEPNDQTSTKSVLVQNLNQSNILTGSSTKSVPDLVQNLNTQKKEKEKKERESGETLENSPARTPIVLAYFEFFPSHTLTAPQVTKINETVTDLMQWRATLEEWAMNSWDGRRIFKILDRYTSGRTAKDERPAGNGNGTKPVDVRPALPIVQPDPNRPDPAESRRKTAELMRERRGI